MSLTERERRGWFEVPPSLNLLLWRLGPARLGSCVACNRLIRLNYCAPMTSQSTTTMMMVGSQLALSDKGRKEDGYRQGMQPVSQGSQPGVRRPPHLFIIIKEAEERERGRERWRRMDHLQHWRNGSLRRSVHSSSLSLSPRPRVRRPLPNPVITEATTEQSERGKERGALL